MERVLKKEENRSKSRKMKEKRRKYMKIKEIVRKVEETVVGKLARYANDRELLPACGDDPEGGQPRKSACLRNL